MYQAGEWRCYDMCSRQSLRFIFNPFYLINLTNKTVITQLSSVQPCAQFQFNTVRMRSGAFSAK